MDGLLWHIIFLQMFFASHAVGVSTPGGSLDRRVNCRCVPQPMGRRETEHEGGEETGKGGTRGLRVALRPGRVRLQ